MQWENLFYALTQCAHNFGALAVVGGALGALSIPAGNPDLKRKLVWLVLIGWGVQAFSGSLFGGISFYFYGETPDLHATAWVALVIKVICAVLGLLLALLYVVRAKNWSNNGRYRVLFGLTGFGATALTAAAFLRWFS
jgi:hypothetical protein